MSLFYFNSKETEPHSEPQSFKTLDFYDHLLFGYIFKTIIMELLDRCGYEVSPFGYESTLPHLKKQLHGINATETATKLRFTPDLIVRDPNQGEVNLVEVKARSASGSRGIRIDEIGYYLKFWPESILVVVLPTKPYFYARYVRDLPSEGPYLLNNFCLFEEIFLRLANLTIDFRCKMVRKVITLFEERQRCNL
jgi:hypothetical protein